MPWKETNAMDVRMRLVMLVADGETVSEAGEEMGTAELVKKVLTDRGKFDQMRRVGKGKRCKANENGVRTNCSSHLR